MKKERNPKLADQRRCLVEEIAHSADIHATDKNGVTALHHAVRFRSPAAVKALIERGANVNQACRRNGIRSANKKPGPGRPSFGPG